ncbi:arylsulfatase [Tuwongella immobilis]|uniref:Sulfatase N-terminal domain-containing protein n=1 Tax=Tuwongella immobilis TaxID=692036 RepID=A0A6C2YP68_9BACT|nr:arylsulfatase [Tuwongella immobilis]VIP03418.1 arylsulfatase a : Arylsulfatase A family protein OS=Singulisphaera acidiphila (strain ATCC BAA-1392 / DSM 18658 / VKM B-2454 / MOB10) GN=Sinac_3461 PE=4 SV=1: Sulfatase [Tuwongella immobilis]VTS04208.1 arylsulfatase a : Arylsulfatase A family protein OS=Singulisphaera acidiphila (strain ATCC BAA-1392 / DSM 18658 / VKM B-2454 / MOB10) GN=Sinac_3461 PE=4 SV=1: Sulfatase [Tuwongella immobilis]
MRHSLLATLGFLVLLGNIHAAAPESLINRKPNIILIMTDDQGYGDLACHGNPILKTPNLDQLHRQSVRFTDFHVSPTCAPTRSALMTGRHEFFNGITHTIFERERLRLDATILPQMLKQQGYRTGIFGKWHLGDEDAYQPQKRGFDEVFIHGAGGIGQTYAGSCGDAPGNRYFDPVIRKNGQFVKTSGYCTDVFFDEMIRWVDSQRKQGPFFAYVTPNAPHAPLDCPVGSDEPYRGKVPNPVAKFYGMIANIDTNMGKLMAKLREWELETNTLLIFMTDNGTATGSQVFNAGMRGAKGTPFTGGTRVPAFWRWTGTLPAGVDVPVLTCHWDILPTFVELTGHQPKPEWKATWQGRSLVPLLQDPKANWPDRIFISHVGRWKNGEAATGRDVQASIRNARWQLVIQNPKKIELFDLKNDPGEQRNVMLEHPEVAAELRAEFNRWWDAVQPNLVNESAKPPAINPFKEAYWRQFGGPGPNQVPPPPGLLR